MRPLQYEVSFSIIAFLMLLAVFLHSNVQGKLEDRNSRLFRKLILTAIADVVFDFVATVVPCIEALHLPILYTALNTVYVQLNVHLSFYILYYTDSLRTGNHGMTRWTKRWTHLPNILTATLLILNFPLKIVFYYDAQGQYHSGVFGQFAYLMAALYIAASIYLLVRYREQYTNRSMTFLGTTFVMLAGFLAVQFISSRLLTIDLGIAFAVLTFYLYNNNPVQYMDTLTGALDKNYFDTWVHDQIEDEKKIYLIAVRVKNMQYINAVRGEKTGNRIMAVMAESLRKFDHEKSVFRLSGSCLMVHCHNEELYHTELKRLEEWFSDETNLPKDARGCVVRLIGIPKAESLIPEYSVNAYIDHLMYRVGSGEEVLTESSLETIAGFRYEMEIERFLREALEQDHFTLAYQPIYHLGEKRVVSVEALSRLVHPSFGNLNPQNVINIAERSGLIGEVTRQQFTHLCQFMKEQPELLERLERFKFNLSPLNLMNRSSIQELIEIIETFDLPYDKFEFEITESFATENNDELGAIIQMCIEKGISLSLDDFGSGYSNLSNVLRIPFKSIKLDRSLLLEVSTNQSIADFYLGIVHLMQNYGKEIICEGVETQAEKDLLESWGADMIQGFYYSKPLDGERLIEFLNK